MRTLFVSPADPGRPRPFWRVVIHSCAWVIVLFALLIPFIALDIALGGHALTGGEANNRVLFTFATFGAALIATRFVTRHIDARPIGDYGLRLDRQWGRDYAAGLGFGAAQMLFVFGVLYAGGWVEIEAVQLTHAIALGVLIDLAAHFGVGIGEELLSRGPLFVNLEETFRIRRLHPVAPALLATAITSTMFGLMHAGNDHASTISNVNLIFAGVALAVPVLLTRQLGISMGAHTSWNFVQGAILGFPVSGHVAVEPIIDTEAAGPRLVTGGAFGPEAGVLMFAADALLIALTIVYVKKTRGRVAILPPPQPRPRKTATAEHVLDSPAVEIPSPS